MLYCKRLLIDLSHTRYLYTYTVKPKELGMHTSERNQTYNLLNLIGNTPVVNIMTSLFPNTIISLQTRSVEYLLKKNASIKMIRRSENVDDIYPTCKLD